MRRDIALRENVPPYIVFNDSTLREMAALRPTTEAEFLRVKGVGEAKIRKFGLPFLKLFREMADTVDEMDDRLEWQE